MAEEHVTMNRSNLKDKNDTLSDDHTKYTEAKKILGFYKYEQVKIIIFFATKEQSSDEYLNQSRN